MPKRKMAPLVAVGLVFTAGGHELTLDWNSAHAATSAGEFAPFSSEPSQRLESCEDEPSSGCMQLLPHINSTTPIHPTGESGMTFCLTSEDSEGASGIACLLMGR